MVFAIKMTILVFSFVLIILNLLPLLICASQVPCFFIFGDSLVDNGNNNPLNSSVKINYWPYGIDFRGGPTGRFTNGKNIADFLAEDLGFTSPIPPFTSAQGNDILKGVNYGSGGAGIRDETGENLGGRINLDTQLQNHNLTISRFVQLRGNEASAKQELNQCLYYFLAGNNDYINNYFKPEYFNTSKTYTPEQYATALIQQYSQQLMTIYNYGARKIAISGVGPIGCLPEEVSKGTNGSFCVTSMNNAVKLFNEKIKSLVSDLNTKLTDAKFIYISATTAQPTELVGIGLRILGTPCCKVDNHGQCVRGQAPCPIRTFYAFYDNFHPTETVNRALATVAYVELGQLILPLIF